MKAYVLVNARPGRSMELAQGIRDVQGMQAADVITGEYDIVVTCESPDINALGTLIVDGIPRLDGVHKTTTCLVVT
jgi:DNA-binding Lrp family transcriptional regulator